MEGVPTALGVGGASVASLGGSMVPVALGVVWALGLALFGDDSGLSTVDAPRIVEAIDDGVIVLGSDDRVLGCDELAGRIATVESPEGRPLVEAFPPVAALVAREGGDGDSATEGEGVLFRGADTVAQGTDTAERGSDAVEEEAGTDDPADGRRDAGSTPTNLGDAGPTPAKSGDTGSAPTERPSEDPTGDVLTLVEDGERVHYEVRTSRLVDGDGPHGETEERVVLLRDVSERIRRERELLERERELRRQNERLDEFASVVSHDLRNPISVASAYLTLARERTEGAGGAFEEVEAALDRMDELTSDLLTIAREGDTVTDRRPVSVAGVAEQAWTTVDCGGATLSIEDDAVVSADRGRLRQLFENLFRNAREHGDAGEVRVGTVEDGFFVADDGAGIPPAEHDRVFERGYSTDPGGSGYGLAIVEEVVAGHGWAVAVTESRDRGARFEVTGVETEPTGNA